MDSNRTRPRMVETIIFDEYQSQRKEVKKPRGNGSRKKRWCKARMDWHKSQKCGIKKFIEYFTVGYRSRTRTDRERLQFSRELIEISKIKNGRMKSRIQDLYQRIDAFENKIKAPYDLETVVEKQARLLYKAGATISHSIGSSNFQFSFKLPKIYLVDVNNPSDNGTVGPFNAVVLLGEALYSRSHQSYYKLSPISGKTPTSRTSYFHPHCSESGSFCLGEYIPTMRKLVETGRIYDLYNLCIALANGYRRGSAYTKLSNITGTKQTDAKCSGCGDMIELEEGEQPRTCVSCDHVLCGDCVLECSCCGENFCGDCSHYLGDCAICKEPVYSCDDDGVQCFEGRFYHENCLANCYDCDATLFPDQVFVCKKCELKYCEDCMDDARPEYCKECAEEVATEEAQQQEGHEHE